MAPFTILLANGLATLCIVTKSHNRFSSLLIPFAAPPASVEMQGYAANSKVEVRQNQDLTLTCVVADAKPAAQIIWLRDKMEFKPGKCRSGPQISTFSD